MNDPTTTTPADFALSPRRDLFDALVDAESVLVDHRHGIGTRRAPSAVADAALLALATARALAAMLLAAEWVAQVEALENGATLADVAAACGLTDAEVLAGLRSGIDAQRERGFMDAGTRERLHRVVDDAAR